MFITTTNQKNLIEEMIDDIFRIYPNSYRHNNSSDYKIDSDEDGLSLIMNVPGYNKKLIDVIVSGDKLSIEGKAHSGDTDGFIHNFTISDNLDSEEIDATVIDGVLTVSIPYVEAVKPRKIEVKVK